MTSLKACNESWKGGSQTHIPHLQISFSFWQGDWATPSTTMQFQGLNPGQPCTDRQTPPSILSLQSLDQSLLLFWGHTWQYQGSLASCKKVMHSIPVQYQSFIFKLLLVLWDKKNLDNVKDLTPFFRGRRWSYTQLRSGLTPGSAYKNHSWGLGDYTVDRTQVAFMQARQTLSTCCTPAPWFGIFYSFIQNFSQRPATFLSSPREALSFPWGRPELENTVFGSCHFNKCFPVRSHCKCS